MSSSTKKAYSKPHLTTSPMFIDVQKRTAKIYERKDVSSSAKKLNVFLSGFVITTMLCGLVLLPFLVVSLLISLITNPPSISASSPNISLIISQLTCIVEIIIFYTLSGVWDTLPLLGGAAWVYLRRDFWAPEIAKLCGRTSVLLSGENKTSITKPESKHVEVFVGKFLRLRWVTSGEHSKYLESINVRPFVVTKAKSKKKRIRGWNAILTYSKLPKTGRTDIYWI